MSVSKRCPRTPWPYRCRLVLRRRRRCRAPARTVAESFPRLTHGPGLRREKPAAFVKHDEEGVAAQHIDGAAGGHGDGHEPAEQVEVVGREQARSRANNRKEGEAEDEQRVF